MVQENELIIAEAPKDEVKCYQIIMQFEDGCEYQFHGSKYEPDWNLALPAGVIVTCPHGYKLECGTGNEIDVLKGGITNESGTEGKKQVFQEEDSDRE